MEGLSKLKVHKFDLQRTFEALCSLKNKRLQVLMPLRWTHLQTSRRPACLEGTALLVLWQQQVLVLPSLQNKGLRCLMPLRILTAPTVPPLDVEKHFCWFGSNRSQKRNVADARMDTSATAGAVSLLQRGGSDVVLGDTSEGGKADAQRAMLAVPLVLPDGPDQRDRCDLP